MSALIVSREVIASALSWMGVPKMYLRHASNVLISDKGTCIQQVTMDFDRWQLHQWLKTTSHADTYNRSTALVAALQDCFCNDVLVISANYPKNTANIRVGILITLGQEKFID